MASAALSSDEGRRFERYDFRHAPAASGFDMPETTPVRSINSPPNRAIFMAIRSEVPTAFPALIDSREREPKPDCAVRESKLSDDCTTDLIDEGGISK